VIVVPLGKEMAYSVDFIDEISTAHSLMSLGKPVVPSKEQIQSVLWINTR